MNEETMRKHYAKTPKETLINILITSREQIEKYKDIVLDLENERDILRSKLDRINDNLNELERYINEEYIYDELGMKIFDASKLQDKLQELKGEDKE